MAHVVLQLPGKQDNPVHHSHYTSYMPAPSSHIKYPSKSNKYKFEQFTSKVDLLIDGDKSSFEIGVTDDDTFIDRYVKLTNILEMAAVSTFGCSTPFQYSNKEVMSPCIHQIVSKLCHVGGAISIARGQTLNSLHGSLAMYDELWCTFCHLYKTTGKSFISYLTEYKHILHQELHAAKKDAVVKQA